MKVYCEKCFMELDNCECELCSICKEIFPPSDLYEYRGEVACAKDFRAAQEKRDFERQEIIEENKVKTDKFRGLDLGNSQIGKANRNILKADIEIAGKESGRIKSYENR